MGVCNDNSNTFLRDVGYNVIKLPRDSFHPLDLLASDGRALQYIGSIDKLLTNSSAPMPNVMVDKVAASVNGNATSSMNISIGLSILNGLIQALGGGTLKLDLGFTNARKSTFQFANVVFDSAAPIDVGKYIQGGEFDANNPLLKNILGHGRLFVVTETLKASEITVKFEKSDGVKATVDVPVIKQAVGANIGVDVQAGSENVVTFKGDPNTRLAFGFKCYEIAYNDGDIEMIAVKAGGVVANVRSEPAAKGVVFDAGLLDVA